MTSATTTTTRGAAPAWSALRDDAMDDEGANATAVGALSEDAGAARRASSSSILREHVAATTTRAAEGYARARGMQLTPRASRALGELAMAFATELARDLRAFAWHADRDVIHARDVELRARKVTPTPFAGDDAAEGDDDAVGGDPVDEDGPRA
jgi:histone H3/H4